MSKQIYAQKLKVGDCYSTDGGKSWRTVKNIEWGSPVDMRGGNLAWVEHVEDVEGETLEDEERVLIST